MSSYVNLEEAKKIVLTYKEIDSDTLAERRYRGKTRKYFRLLEKFLQVRSLQNTTMHCYAIFLFHFVHSHFLGSNKVSLESDFYKPFMKILKMSFGKKKSIDYKHPLSQKMRAFSQLCGEKKKEFDDLYYLITSFPDYTREDIAWIEKAFNPTGEIYPIPSYKAGINFEERKIDELIRFVKEGNQEDLQKRYYLLGVDYFKRRKRIIASSTDEYWMMNIEAVIGCSLHDSLEMFLVCTLGEDSEFVKHCDHYMREYYAEEELKKEERITRKEKESGIVANLRGII